MAPLHGVHALLFDVFGTVVDWHSSVVAALAAAGAGGPGEHAPDWGALATEWRAGYLRTTSAPIARPSVSNVFRSLHVARGGEGPPTVDAMHREVRPSMNCARTHPCPQLLDELLASPRWRALAPVWDDDTRRTLCLAWHRLHPWPDAAPALHALKATHIVGTLSNGNVRLLVDLAKHAGLPWDVVFSSELFGSYKPNPAVYDGAVRCLALPPHAVVLVAAHLADCRAAKACGLRAVYVRRATEDIGVAVDETHVDAVVDDFDGLARLLHVE